MPGDDVERVRASFERWNLGERDLGGDEVHPDLEMHTPLSSTRGEPYRGRAGFRQWLGDISEQFDRWELRPTEFRDLGGGRVFILGSILLRGRESQAEIEQPMSWLFELRDGLLWRYTVWTSHDEGLAAVSES